MTQSIEQLEARLEKVRAAIDCALTGKRYRIEDGDTSRELERQSLKDLTAMEASLVAQIARAGGNGIRHAVPI